MGFYDDYFDRLKNKRILRVEWDNDTIHFVTKERNYSYAAVGDCCSTSFIEDLDNPQVFNDAIFLEVESVDGECKPVDEWSVHKWTFYKFKTDKGMCTLSFRNESNGYYDGNLQPIN